MYHFGSIFGICFLSYIIFNMDLIFAEHNPVTFTFKEYQYKDSPKNEMTFREFETACEQSSACSHMTGLQRTRCVRECVSPSCFRELYQADPIYTALMYKRKSLIDEVSCKVKLQ